MRKLIYIPIVHTSIDMGTESEFVRKEYIKRLGRKNYLKKQTIIEDIWEDIRKKIISLNLNFEKIRIYQDGLPFSGNELQIVRNVASNGSKNYQLILELIYKGAMLEGTEDPELLIEEYNLIKNISSAKTEKEKRITRDEYKKESSRILRQRDAFIAKRIDETLKENETGLLFIGLIHEVNLFLPHDISIHYLIHPLRLKDGNPE